MLNSMCSISSCQILLLLNTFYSWGQSDPRDVCLQKMIYIKLLTKLAIYVIIQRSEIYIFFNDLWGKMIKRNSQVAELLTSNGVSKLSMMPPTMSSPSVLIPMPWCTQSTVSSREQSTYSARCLAEMLMATWCHFPSDRLLTGNLPEKQRA